MITCGKFPTMDDSFCRSLCRPRPLCARCSRITAMSMLVPSRPPSDLGSPYRSQPALSARRRISESRSSHSRVGMPSLSQSVRACSRRWSKYCVFSACSGAISRSMNASISASSPGRCSGRVKSTAISLRSRRAAVQSLFPDRRQGRNGILVADLEAQSFGSGTPDEHRGEVLEQQGDGRGGVLGFELGSMALLLGPADRGRHDVHAESPKLILHAGKPLLGCRELGPRDHDAYVMVEAYPTAAEH